MSDETDYVNRRKVRAELDYAMSLFERGGFNKLNVSNKPIEYSANRIITQLTDTFGADKWQRDEV